MTAKKPTRQRRSFGRLRKTSSGRYQAGYVGPDAILHTAPATFTAKVDAEGWLAAERRLIEQGLWSAPSTRKNRAAPATFGDYAESWLRRRTPELKPRTAAHYRRILDRFLLPPFGTTPIASITTLMVNEWFAEMKLATGDTYRAHAYALLRTIMGTAVVEEVITRSPVTIRGAGRSRTQKKIEPATLEEIAALTAAMPEALQMMVPVAAWCALRFGEVTELRRKDIDLKNGILHVRRGVSWVKGEPIISTPKTASSVRDVAIPPHLVPMLREHIEKYGEWGRDGLLFHDGDRGHISHARFTRAYNPARKAAGRDDLNFHALRHTGAVMAAQTGATLKELMARLGHTTPDMAMRYQHAAADRDAEIARKLSDLAKGTG